MKNYEQKYNELVEKLQTAKEKSGGYTFTSVIDTILPELKESEDERIRKALTEYFRWNVQQILNDFNNKEVLAWLEKQKEQSEKYSLKQAAEIFLNALSETPYNNKPITDAQVITKELLKFLENASSYNPDALIEEKLDEWDDEDEENLNGIIEYFEKNLPATASDWIDWLESLKQNHKKKKWSREDDKMINSIATHLNATTSGIPEDREWANEFMNWLKSLKPQQKQEWSEEDEKMLANVVATLERNGIYGTLAEQINWVKHLKPRWKPNEKQMECLDKAIPLCIGEVGRDAVLPLESLYNDLKNFEI